MTRPLKLDDPRVIRLKALKDAAKAVCRRCYAGSEPVESADSSELVHLSLGYPPRDCDATAIYDLITIEELE